MKKLATILFLFNFCFGFSQKDTLPYNPKQELEFDGKRYRKYNNYLTLGIGKAFSNVRSKDQSLISVDFHFHLQRHYLQIGFFMSGDQLLANNNISGHLCYGLRRERNRTNFAAFVGPSYDNFVVAKEDSVGYFHPVINNVLGGYISLQGIYKFKYDLGIGVELFADINEKQQLFGGRIVVYLSGAYRGEKRGFKSKPK